MYCPVEGFIIKVPVPAVGCPFENVPPTVLISFVPALPETGTLIVVLVPSLTAVGHTVFTKTVTVLLPTHELVPDTVVANKEYVVVVVGLTIAVAEIIGPGVQVYAVAPEPIKAIVDEAQVVGLAGATAKPEISDST